MPTFGYALKFNEDTDSILDALEAATKNAYRDLGIALTGALWKQFYRDRTAPTKAIPSFRQRRIGTEIAHGARSGDVVMAPEFRRAFIHVKDFLVNAVAWHKAKVRLIILDVGFDSASDTGQRMLAILAAMDAKRARKPARKAHNGGRPMMGLVVHGPRKERYLAVDKNIYELGMKVRQWAEEGWSYDAIAEHLFKSEVYRPRYTRGRGVFRSAVAQLLWEPKPLEKLGSNIPIIDNLVLDGKVRLPAGWRPASGPLATAEAVECKNSPPEDLTRAVQIGKRIRLLRREKAWTQKALAAKCETSQSFICDMEKGRHLPLPTTLERVARALAVPVEALTVALRKRGQYGDTSPETSSSETASADTSNSTPPADSA